MQADWENNMPGLILGGMALAAMIAIFVVVLVSVRRREAHPLLAVAAFLGILWISLLPFGAALEGRLLDPLFGPHPDQVRHRVVAALNETMRVGLFAAGCAIIAWALFSIGAALAMLPRLRSGRALRLAALVRRGSLDILQRWDELPLRIRVRLWIGYLVASAVWLGFGAVLIAGAVRKAIAPAILPVVFLVLLVMGIVDVQLWYYGRLARRMRQEPVADQSDQAAAM
jgi:hypothetical protein